MAVDSEKITVGAGGKLIVPREEFGLDADEGEELGDEEDIKIRRPKRREWIVLNVEAESQVKLIIYKKSEDDIETHHYFVHPKLRSGIRDELKAVRIIPYCLIKTGKLYLWDIPVTIDNSWYESKNRLLKVMLFSSRI